MALYNTEKNEIIIKIVYFGAPNSGKKSNLSYLHANLPVESHSEIKSLSMGADKFVFMSCYSETNREIGGMTAGMHIYSPVGKLSNSTSYSRLFDGVDAVVFVADSLESRKEANLEYFELLKGALKDCKLDVGNIAMVMQFNKIDLVGEILNEEEMHELLNAELNSPFYCSVASEGIRVEDTLDGVSKIAFNTISAKLAGKEKVDFVTFSSMDKILEGYDSVGEFPEEEDNDNIDMKASSVSMENIETGEDDDEFPFLDNILFDDGSDNEEENSGEDNWKLHASELFNGSDSQKSVELENPFISLGEEDIDNSILGIENGCSSSVGKHREHSLSTSSVSEKKKIAEIEDLGHENWLKDDSPKVINLNIDRKTLVDNGGVLDKNLTIPISFKLGDEKINLSLNLDIRIYLNE